MPHALSPGSLQLSSHVGSLHRLGNLRSCEKKIGLASSYCSLRTRYISASRNVRFVLVALTVRWPSPCTRSKPPAHGTRSGPLRLSLKSTRTPRELACWLPLCSQAPVSHRPAGVLSWLLVVGPVECHGHSLPQFSIRGDVVSRASQQVRDILLDKGLTHKISQNVFPRLRRIAPRSGVSPARPICGNATDQASARSIF